MVGQQPNCLALQGIAPPCSTPPKTKIILKFDFGHWGISPNLEPEPLLLVNNDPRHSAPLCELLNPLVFVHKGRFYAKDRPVVQVSLLRAVP
jgi:hypothetical protein